MKFILIVLGIELRTCDKFLRGMMMEEVDTSYLVLVLNLDCYLSSMEIHWYLISGIWNVLSNFTDSFYPLKVMLRSPPSTME